MKQRTLSTILFGAFACAAPQKAEVSEGSLAVSVDRIMPLAESLDAAAVEVTLKLVNPTSKPIAIAQVSYAIDTKDVGGVISGTAEGGASVEAKQEAELKFRQSIPFPKDDAAYRAILDRATVPLSLTGEVKLADGDAVKFARVSEIATPTLPKFVVHDAQAARYGKTGVDVTLFLRLINENVFPVHIEGVDFTVHVAGKKVKSESAALGVKILPAAAEEYEVNTVLDEKKYSKDEVKAILDSRRVQYKVTGKVEIPRATIPFEYAGEIELATGE